MCALRKCVDVAVARQLLVAVSAILAAMSVGFSVAFPSVLLKQLAHNDSAIHLDLDTASWIGSIHGMAGIPSIIMPALMQWKGRKFIFIATCLISTTGWVIAFTATTTSAILISECFHGFSSHSLLAVGTLTMSEMLSPRFRNITMPLYSVSQILSMALIAFVGLYMHWRSLSIVMSIPIIMATIIACFWTESPFWLAYKGEFEKCVKTFTALRGSSDISKFELEELIVAQKENLLNDKWEKQSALKYFCQKVKCRDFYLPCMHVFVLLDFVYWSGSMVLLIYGSDIFQRVTHTKDFYPVESLLLYYSLIGGCVANYIATRYFNPRNVLLTCVICTVASFVSCIAVYYWQSIGFVSNELRICVYLLVSACFFISQSVPLVVSISAELMPVKHRGISGPLYVIITCVLHATSLKISPYLFIYINVWGTLLIFALNAAVCGLIMWKCIPDTKGRTLQQLEHFYTYGNFKTHRTDDVSIKELIPLESY